ETSATRMSGSSAPRNATVGATATRSSGATAHEAPKHAALGVAHVVHSAPTRYPDLPHRPRLGRARAWRSNSMRMDATARRHDSNVIVLNPGAIDPLANQARECLRRLAGAIAQLSTRVDERFGRA